MILAASDDVARVLLELGFVLSALALLARAVDRIGLSPIPLYLVAGLVVGRGGIVQLDLSEDFIRIGADVGVVLLLLALGLEYSPDDLLAGLRAGWVSGIIDFFANFTPGLVCGLLLGWDDRAALLLGGVTYISSSGVIAKVLDDLGRLGNRETPAVLSVLVIEDLAMAVYLPLAAVLVVGSSIVAGSVATAVAVTTVAVALYLALRHGAVLSRLLFSRSNEVLLLSVVGLTLLVGGAAEQVQVSAAVGAFLVGVALVGAGVRTRLRADRAAAGPVRGGVLLLLRVEREYGCPPVGGRRCDRTRCRDGNDEGGHRVVGSRATRRGPARSPAGGNGSRRPRRILDRHRWPRRGGGRRTRPRDRLGCLRAAASDHGTDPDPLRGETRAG